MSYDIALTIATGAGKKATAWSWDGFTYNLCRMLDEAGIDLRTMNGCGAGAVAINIQSAARAMLAEPDRFRALSPPNGWGTYEGCLEFVQQFAEACCVHPNCTIEVS